MRKSPGQVVAVGGLATVLLCFGLVPSAAAAPRGFPPAPKSAVLVDHHSRSGAHIAEYRIKGRSPASITRYYREAFGERGFVVRSRTSRSEFSYLYMKRKHMKHKRIYAFVGAARTTGKTVRYEVCRGTDKVQVDVCG